MSAAVVIPSLLPLFMVMTIRRAESGICLQLADAIALSQRSRFFLLLYFAAWQPIVDVWHERLESAHPQADSEFTNLSADIWESCL